MTVKAANKQGFSLIELLIVIIIIGIMTSLAMQSMTALVKDARAIKTEREMEMLSKAIVGDPSVMSGGARADFGYVGDVGAFPSSLQDLYFNPGGYATWSGPYIKPGFSEDVTGFKTDEWGMAYTYNGGVTISSTGSGTTITKKIANATTDYTLNQLSGTVKDANDSLPGIIYRDSVSIEITIPNGAGGTTTKYYSPEASGSFTLDSLSVGRHPLRIIYVPNADTLHRYVTIFPRNRSTSTYIFASGYFSGGP